MRPKDIEQIELAAASFFSEKGQPIKNQLELQNGAVASFFSIDKCLAVAYEAVGDGRSGTVRKIRRLKVDAENPDRLSISPVKEVLKKQGYSHKRNKTEENLFKQMNPGSLVQTAQKTSSSGKNKQCLIMPYLGKSLRDYLIQHAQTLTITQLIQLAIDLTEKVKSFHKETEYVHHDIKPKNFIVDKYKQVSLIDFEFALKIGEIAGAAGGTKNFHSPEQKEKNYQCGIEADVYSLGITLKSLFGILTLHGEQSNADDAPVILKTKSLLFGKYFCSEVATEIKELLDKMCLTEKQNRIDLGVALEQLSAIKDRQIQGQQNKNALQLPYKGRLLNRPRAQKKDESQQQKIASFFKKVGIKLTPSCLKI